MFIVKILLILIILIVLFVMFLRHRLEFYFETPRSRKFQYSNMFMKYSNGPNGGCFEFLIKFKKANKKEKEKVSSDTGETESRAAVKKETEIEKITPVKPVEIREEQKEKTKSKPQKTESPSKPVKTVKEHEEDDEIGEFKVEYTQKDDKTLWDWVEDAKKLWQKEEKFVKSVLKYILRLIKISLKLLTPAKINLSAEGGFEDPAETGWLYSVFILINQYFEKSKRINLNFTPQFTDAEWKAEGQIVYSFSIARLLFFVLLILVTFPYYQTIKYRWRNRKSLKHKK